MPGTLEELIEAAEPSPEQPPARKKKRGGIVLTVLGCVLVAGGLTIGIGTLVAPQAVEQVYGNVKTEVLGSVQKVQQNVLAEYPSVTLGASGGMAELDEACRDSTFVEMISYERDGVPPVWAAHNNCGGDVLLPWELGGKIMIGDQLYEIVDIRFTSKVWSSTDDLLGLKGALALQSCFYGEDRMKFVGLEPVAS